MATMSCFWSSAWLATTSRGSAGGRADRRARAVAVGKQLGESPAIGPDTMSRRAASDWAGQVCQGIYKPTCERSPCWPQSMKAVVSELVAAASTARRGRVAEARGDVLQPERVIGEASYL